MFSSNQKERKISPELKEMLSHYVSKIKVLKTLREEALTRNAFSDTSTEEKLNAVLKRSKIIKKLNLNIEKCYSEYDFLIECAVSIYGPVKEEAVTGFLFSEVLAGKGYQMI